MASLTTTTTAIFLPHNSFFFNSHSNSRSLTLSSNLLHFHCRLSSVPRKCSRFRVFRAIGNPKFDFSFPNFNSDDDDGGFNGRTRGRGRKKSSQRKQKRWWSDEDDDDDDDDYEVESGFLDRVVDNLWILQVFRSYGWFTPIILLSFLITTGPKAFLMAFSIPFGLSVLIFAYQEWLEGRRKPRNRHRKRSKYGRRNDAFVEKYEQYEDSQQGKRNKKRDYQSQISQNNGSFYGSQNGSGVSGNNFGGWDELVSNAETKHAQRPPQENGRPTIVEEDKRLSRSMEDRDLPLLLKLLVAVFPFLASWTDFL